MNFIIFDLEATCWEDRSIKLQNEIIEIGAIKINLAGERVSEFCEFIKPKLNPVLSDFCKQLTKIKQAEVDFADPFDMVIDRFKKWVKLDEPHLFCSWGFYDKKQIILDCALYGLDRNWIEKHISLKHQYERIKNLNRPIGMGGALKLEGFKLDGTHHRAIDDAKNISKIFLTNLDKWVID